MKPFYIVLFAAAWLAGMAPLARADMPAPAVTNAAAATPADDPIMARGQGFTIHRSDMNQVVKTLMASRPTDRLPADAEIHIVNQLIEIQLVLQQATDAEKAAGQAAADLKLANLQKSMSSAAFIHRLQTTGMTVSDLRLKLSQELTAQASLTRQLGINVTEAEARKYYDDHPALARQPELAQVRELLLATTAGTSDLRLPDDVIATKHQQIFELYQRAQAGEDFAQLARQYNEDPGSKASGGELPPFRADQMEFGDLAFSLQTSQFSGVLTNSDGYRFFQLLEKTPARTIEYSELADRIMKGLIGAQKNERAPAYLEKLQKAAGVEIVDPSLKELISEQSK